MSARIVTTSTLALAVAAGLPAWAADPQLLNLVMPDAKVLAGVNVDQAKSSQFGQYVLSQMQTQDADLKKLEAQTGFDPTRDVHELLVATNAVNGTPESNQKGLFLARGTFDATKIQATATADGATTEGYKGVTIIEDPQATHGVAFLSTTLVVAGDLANVKAAIDRQSGGATIPTSLVNTVNHWSNSQDAWLVSNVMPSSLHPPAGAPNVPGLNGQGAFATLQSAAGGVKFGSLVVVTGQAVSDNPQDAQQMADALKLLVMMAQMQASKDPTAAQLANSVQVSASGTNVNVSVSLPENQLQQLLKPHPNTNVRRGGDRTIHQN